MLLSVSRLAGCSSLQARRLATVHGTFPQPYWFKPKQVDRNTPACRVKTGGVLRQGDQLWQIISAIESRQVPGADVEKARAANVDHVVAWTERNIATRATRPARYLPTDVVQFLPIARRVASISAIHRFPPSYEGGKEKIKIWAWLDTPYIDGRSEAMLDAERSGLFDAVVAGEIDVGAKVYVHYCDETPLYISHPVDPAHLPRITDPTWTPIVLDPSILQKARQQA